MNHTSIYSMFSRCLCSLNARFTPIFLKIALIPHLLMFCRIKRKIEQGKIKKHKRKNWLFICFAKAKRTFRCSETQASKRRGLEFTSANEALIKRHQWVHLSKAHLHRGERRLFRLKTPALCQGEEHRAGKTNRIFLAYFSNPVYIYIYIYIYLRLDQGSIFKRENTLLRVSPLFFLNHFRVCDFVYFTLDLV